MMNLNLPDLKVESIATAPAVGPDAMVRLSQGEYSGNEVLIDLHASQVLLIAERLGIVPVVDRDAQRTIARLSRQMRSLFERIQYLDDWLHRCSDTAHADLDYEQDYARATFEIAREFVLELPDRSAATAAAGGGVGSDTESAVGAAASTSGPGAQLPLEAT